VLDVVKLRQGKRVAVVGDDLRLLGEVRRRAERLGVRCYELYTVADLDLWRRQEGESLQAGLVLSRLEAVKGFEFDTVVVCGLSEGTLPRPGTPSEEYWREAAVVYAALTRARDELVITYVGQPSVFLNAMVGDVDWHDGAVGEQLTRSIVGL
jgi:superfamily I DNA/RNA helicase